MALHVKFHAHVINTKVACATSLQPHEIKNIYMMSGSIQ